MLLGLALAFEPREPGIMRRPPRPPNAPILSGELIFRILLVGLLIYLLVFLPLRKMREGGLPSVKTE